jgi:mannose-1-phosphate guanylyltransferase/mannose-6-phosphate isomerase
LVVVGVTPTRPEPGYGYIECGAEISAGASAVLRFVEKPDGENAQRFLAAGNFLWNAGIVVARANVLLSELSEHCADVMDAAREATSHARSAHDAIMLDESAYAKSPSISFDYAVLEKSRKLAVVRADFAWADLGTWTAMRQSQEADANGNVLSGKVHAEDCRNVYVRSDAGSVAVIGLEDIIVVRSGDAVLIAPMSRAQEIGKLGTALGAFKKPPE